MEQKGSFIGFTFGNRHSSKLGILRTSESNRYSIDLSPQLKEATLELNAMDGSYYWGSNYTKREIPISFAFYGLTEEQIRQLKQVFNDKKIHPLILDEEPYKVWSAKLTGVMVCKHICYEENDTRFYCGEGNFTFTTFYPFARSRYEYIEDYTEENITEWIDSNSLLVDEFEEGIIYPAILSYGYSEADNTASIVGNEDSFRMWLDDMHLLTDSSLPIYDINSYVDFFLGNGAYNNLEEWREASGIPSQEEYGKYDQGAYKLFNAGDVPMHFQLYIPIIDSPITFEIECGSNKLKIKDLIAQPGDAYLLLDTFYHVAIGCNTSYKKTKNLYNQYIVNGDFFELPTGECVLKSPIEGRLVYKYLYL